MGIVRMRIKLFLRKDDSRVLVFSLIFGIIVLVINRNAGVLRNLSDLLFVVGIFHILAGGIRYISNVGLFKTFSYMAYKHKWKRQTDHTDGMHPMSLGEYTMKVVWDETRQKDVWPIIGKGAVVLVISLALAGLETLV